MFLMKIMLRSKCYTEVMFLKEIQFDTALACQHQGKVCLPKRHCAMKAYGGVEA
jgi:hypothetical protein